MTVEGEKDDISGVGQTEAAQDLCVNIPDDLRMHYVQKDVGHYGVFNGSRFRKEIAPRVCAFHARVEAFKAASRSKPPDRPLVSRPIRRAGLCRSVGGAAARHCARSGAQRRRLERLVDHHHVLCRAPAPAFRRERSAVIRAAGRDAPNLQRKATMASTPSPSSR